jgi:hypothetical protein
MPPPPPRPLLERREGRWQDAASSSPALLERREGRWQDAGPLRLPSHSAASLPQLRGRTRGGEREELPPPLPPLLLNRGGGS